LTKKNSNQIVEDEQERVKSFVLHYPYCKHQAILSLILAGMTFLIYLDMASIRVLYFLALSKIVTEREDKYASLTLANKISGQTPGAEQEGINLSCLELSYCSKLVQTYKG